MKDNIIITAVASRLIMLLSITTSRGTGLLLQESNTLVNKRTCILEDYLAQCSPMSCVQTLNQQDVIASIVTVTDSLGRMKGIIIHDKDTESLANGVFQTENLTAFVQKLETFNITESVHDRISRGLIILLCGLSCVRDVLHQVQMYSTTHAGRSFLPFYSQWLIVSDASSRAELITAADNIDNIAIMTVPKMNCTSKSQTGRHCQISSQCYKGNISLHTLMWTKTGRRLMEIHLPCGTLETNMNIYPNRRYGLNGRTLIIAVETWDPLLIVRTSANNTDIYSGISIDLINELAGALNFSYRITRPSDNEFGVFRNGSWSGMVGQLERREVDLVMSLNVIYERAKVIDYTYPFGHDYFVMAMKKPNTRETKWFILANIFQWPVILTIAICVLWIVISIYLSEYSNLRPPQNIRKISWLKIAMQVFGILVMRSGTFLPLSRSGRIILVAFSYLAIIISATYTGNLVASFMVTDNEAPISTLEDLVAQNQYTWGTLSGISLTNILQESNLTTLKNIWHGITTFQEKGEDVLNPRQEFHIEKLKRGGYVYLMDQMSVEALMDCKISIAKEKFIPLPIAFGVQKGSPLTQLFSDQVMAILENGIMAKIWQAWTKRNNSCEQTEQLIIAKEGLQLMYLEAAFSILLIGMVLALLSLGVELSLKDIRKNSPNAFVSRLTGN